SLTFAGQDLHDPQVLLRVRGSRIGMIFQEPGAALNPLYTAEFHLLETLRCHKKLSLGQARQRARQLLAEVNLPETVLHRYPHQLSGGQQQRLLIALALAGDPELLLADEPTTALDVTIQAQIMALLQNLQQQRHMALIFITHDLALLSQLTDQMLVLCQGRLVEQGCLSAPQHPYTQGLLACRPPLDRVLHRLPTLRDPQEVRVVSEQEQWQRWQQLQSQAPLLSVRQLTTVFRVPGGEIRAVNGLSFDLYPGETLGIVGESGSGKSTLARTLLHLVPAKQGQVFFQGQPWRPTRARRRQIQMIFQDPYNALNPRLTVGAAILEPMLVHRLVPNPQAGAAQVQTLLQHVGLEPDAAQRYPNQFSGGQRQRIAIARALACQPLLLICDECVSALDVSIQAQILNLLKDLQTTFQLTYICSSHALRVVRFLADRVLVLRHGQPVELAPAPSLYRDPQQDYTRQLLAAVPQLQRPCG
ncbi:MAG: ABC transporter ATP-binding protein, partial [Thermostichales cyanobacterium SRBZ-1_bins_19]